MAKLRDKFGKFASVGINWENALLELESVEYERSEWDWDGWRREVYVARCWDLYDLGQCEEWWEAAEREADKHGLYITSSEGDPCDIMIGQCKVA